MSEVTDGSRPEIQLSVAIYRKCLRKWLQMNGREHWTIMQICDRLKENSVDVMKQLEMDTIIWSQPLLNQIPE